MSVRHRRGPGRLRGAGFALSLLALFGVFGAQAAADDPFPEPRPATRTEAAALVSGRSAAPDACLTAKIGAAVHGPGLRSPGVRRAIAVLEHRAFGELDRTFYAADGTRLRYRAGSGSLDGMATETLDEDGRPEVVRATLLGLHEARGLLVESMQLPAPERLEVIHLDLGGEPRGYLIGGEGRVTTLVVDASRASGLDDVRRAAIHQYAHAVALATNPQFPVDWAEALATWTELTLNGRLGAGSAGRLSRRLERLDSGLFANDIGLAAGNAVWLAFVDEAYGPAAVRATIEELAADPTAADALDRALRRTTEDDLVSAFREFHLWSIFVGVRADRFHFSFAEELATPAFASTTEGLPALSVQADPAVAPWGAAQVRIRPESGSGGMRIHFEGEFTARWEADLILIGDAGTRRRLSLELSPEGRGESIVPLEGLDEVLLLVRNLGSDGSVPRRYTYAVDRERDYPFEIASLEATTTDGPGGGVAIVWETASEQELIGFNILRVREDGGRRVTVNPVWIPALGDTFNPTSYRFLDATAEPGASYIYRIQGITTHGLTSLSDPVIARRPSPRR